MQLNITIVSPSKIHLKGDFDELIVPSLNGETGILAGHADYLTRLGPGEIITIDKGVRQSFTIKSGIAKVKQNKVVVLIQDAVS